MELELAPLFEVRQFHDPAQTGEWAAAFKGISKVAQNPPWCSYLARRDDVAVGVGGFKGPLDAAGWVEIAYIIFIPWRAQGIATALAAELVEIAWAQGAEGALAHTMPEVNASTRVLAANGFTQTRELVDPDDGLVWRWERKLR